MCAEQSRDCAVLRWTGVVACALAFGCASQQTLTPSTPPLAEAPRAYIFGWSFLAEELRPRGGTTTGEAGEIETEPTDAWLRLQSDALAPAERDRAAILAMAGTYRVSFDFLETVVFSAEPAPSRPYRSWATEQVYVLEDADDFVSLQHILVMVYLDSTGAAGEPFVMKHWRQDWQYEPIRVMDFRGGRTWRHRDVDEAGGVWSQTVYHVDDSPRYATIGRWQHDEDFSIWTGNRTWRPLPRREHSVRDDYDVLESVNRVTVLPTG